VADFGVDLWCQDDIDPTGATVSGPLIVAQACYRRLTTRRLGLVGDPNYGYDVEDIINADVTQADLARHQAAIEAECLKDERVQGAPTTCVMTAGVLTIGIALDLGDGPFALVLAVSQVGVSLLTGPSA
jgi:hypothetical protein